MMHIKQLRGFTLVELAIVLIIIGLLLAMFLSPLTAQREIRARSETLSLLEQAREALMGYVVIHRHLPCADTDMPPDGIENRDEVAGSCSKPEGVLPWNTLGIEPSDAWNHYFRYRVDATFANSVTLFTLADAIGATGISISGENEAALVSTNSRPAAVVISYGLNGYGAINSVSPYKSLPAPTGADELENADGDVNFVSHVPTAKGSSNEFDDMLIWISPKVLINRMIMAQRLP